MNNTLASAAVMIFLIAVSLSYPAYAHGRGFLIPHSWAAVNKPTVYSLHVSAEEGVDVSSFVVIIPPGFVIEEYLGPSECKLSTRAETRLTCNMTIAAGGHVEFTAFKAINPPEAGVYRWVLVRNYADGTSKRASQLLWVSAKPGEDAGIDYGFVAQALVLVAAAAAVAAYVVRGRGRRSRAG